ncbi:hypothetical protein Leryth_021765 [Lithospermum erythrorhizon]|nr:hypothetical protein Leryth_021765 [Lithospermum erythrorhizon]
MIPPQWASTNLYYLLVGDNCLSGSIPGYLGEIKTLTILAVGGNMFSGDVPATLGNLVNLEYLDLSTNNLTGELPSELYRLTKLFGLIVSRNFFVGKLPNFSNWLKLQVLRIEASGFEGPIPSNLSLLNDLGELRISDLKGTNFDFPQLKNMNLNILVLRNCSISATIPNYLLNMTYLRIL